MKHRATVVRPDDAPPPAGAQPAAGGLSWTGAWDDTPDVATDDAEAPTVITDAQPCYWWTTSGSRVSETGKLFTVSMHKMLTPIDADLAEGDRITQVADRLGNVKTATPLRVLSVLPKSDHLAITLEEVS